MFRNTTETSKNTGKKQLIAVSDVLMSEEKSELPNGTSIDAGI